MLLRDFTVGNAGVSDLGAIEIIPRKIRISRGVYVALGQVHRPIVSAAIGADQRPFDFS
mgnify:CR=1 FL=1